MNWKMLPLLALSVGCSSSPTGAEVGYERAIECETLTSLVGAFYPRLDRSEVQGLIAAYQFYSARASASGAAAGKSEREIEQDRLAKAQEIQRRLRGPGRLQAGRANVEGAARCLREMP